MKQIAMSVLPWLLLGLLGALINWLLEFPTSEEWEAYKREHPKRAAAIKMFRRIFPWISRIPLLKPVVDAVNDAKKVAEEEKKEAEKKEAEKTSEEK